ncbi:LacI family DNA-binding transcriptional regulator [Paenibacillus alkaliterrae]|uniref:LacI family DNA-binding transcriptional regulator n=1 Tax=Paenibacillus alkaliterrae TaxID=320909 RepID=UPI001F192881|nr:LacI family DNA-binding transcriptional regulator [Paenibacillus alkaliterrae]MCF2939684.1 LacI family DNA-binding transcriptional regulator [Paenibacillus alkaliterrae]
MKQLKVTMQMIADTLHISKNSVSQALTGKGGVSDETRQLVIETAQKLGYRYSETRKNRQPERSGSIALIASDFAFSQRSFFGEIYLSIEQECSKRGMTLQIQSVNPQARDGLVLPSFLQNQSVDGVLVLSHISTDYINTVLATGIPTVLIDHHHPRIHADCILTNNRFGGYDAVNHLIRLGHKQIGFWGNVSFSPSYQERLEGYHMAMNEAGLAVNPDWLVKDASEESTDVTDKFLRMTSLPTAWFCVNDGLGFLLISSLQQLGHKVPDDFSVCSFDNGQLSRINTPTTTTMGVDLSKFGQKAIQQLFWRINNPSEPYIEILLPTTLIERESTSKPSDDIS